MYDRAVSKNIEKILERMNAQIKLISLNPIDPVSDIYLFLYLHVSVWCWLDTRKSCNVPLRLLYKEVGFCRPSNSTTIKASSQEGRTLNRKDYHTYNLAASCEHFSADSRNIWEHCSYRGRHHKGSSAQNLATTAAALLKFLIPTYIRLWRYNTKHYHCSSVVFHHTIVPLP